MLWFCDSDGPEMMIEKSRPITVMAGSAGYVIVVVSASTVMVSTLVETNPPAPSKEVAV